MNPTTAALQYSIELDDRPARESTSRMQAALETMEKIIQSIGNAVVEAKNKAMDGVGAIGHFFEEAFAKLQELSKLMMAGPVAAADYFYKVLASMEPIWFRIRTQAQTYARSLLEVTGEQKRQLGVLKEHESVWKRITDNVREHRKLIVDAALAAAPVALAGKGMIEQHNLRRFTQENPNLNLKDLDRINLMSKAQGSEISWMGFSDDDVRQAYLEFAKAKIPLDKWNETLRLTSKQAYATGESLQATAAGVSQLSLSVGGSYAAMDKYVGIGQALAGVLKTSVSDIFSMNQEAVEAGKKVGLSGLALVEHAGAATAYRGAFKSVGAEGVDPLLSGLVNDIALGSLQLGPQSRTQLALFGIRENKDIDAMQAQEKVGNTAAVYERLSKGLHEYLEGKRDEHGRITRPGTTPELATLQLRGGEDKEFQGSLEQYRARWEEFQQISTSAAATLPGAVSKDAHKDLTQQFATLWNQVKRPAILIKTKLYQGFREMTQPLADHLGGMSTALEAVNDWLEKPENLSPKHFAEGLVAAVVGWKVALKPLLKIGLKSGLGKLGSLLVKHSQGGWKYVGHAMQFVAAPYKHLTEWLGRNPVANPVSAKIGKAIETVGTKLGVGGPGPLGKLARWAGPKLGKVARIAGTALSARDLIAVTQDLKKQNIGEQFANMAMAHEDKDEKRSVWQKMNPFASLQDALEDIGNLKGLQVKVQKSLAKAWGPISWIGDLSGYIEKIGTGLGKFWDWWQQTEELPGQLFGKVIDSFKDKVLTVFDSIYLGIAEGAQKLLPKWAFNQLFPEFEAVKKDIQASRKAKEGPSAASVVPPQHHDLVPGSPAWRAKQARVGGHSGQWETMPPPTNAPTTPVPSQDLTKSRSPIVAAAAAARAAGAPSPISTQAAPGSPLTAPPGGAQRPAQGQRDAPSAITPEFWTRVLGNLGAAATQTNIESLQAWSRREGTRAHWNPLATTKGGYPGETNFNSAGVKNYPDEATGALATADTLKKYTKVMAALMQSLPSTQWASAGVSSDLLRWSGGGYSSLPTVTAASMASLPPTAEDPASQRTGEGHSTYVPPPGRPATTVGETRQAAMAPPMEGSVPLTDNRQASAPVVNVHQEEVVKKLDELIQLLRDQKATTRVAPAKSQPNSGSDYARRTVQFAT